MGHISLKCSHINTIVIIINRLNFQDEEQLSIYHKLTGPHDCTYIEKRNAINDVILLIIENCLGICKISHKLKLLNSHSIHPNIVDRNIFKFLTITNDGI